MKSGTLAGLVLIVMLAVVAPLAAEPSGVPRLTAAAPAASVGVAGAAHAGPRGGATKAQVRPESRLKRQLRRASDDIDTFWRKENAELGRTYTSPRLRTFQAEARSGCGHLASGVGPFYCALDQTIYVDVPFIRQIAFLRDPFVLRTIFAHEWAHHIQYLSGYEAAVFPKGRGEVYSMQLELHADCLAGVWARGEVDAGKATEDDLRNAMILAYATGDPEDSSLLAPDAHGTSDMRLGAFMMGLEMGRSRPCDREILKLL